MCCKLNQHQSIVAHKSRGMSTMAAIIRHTKTSKVVRGGGKMSLSAKMLLPSGWGLTPRHTGSCWHLGQCLKRTDVRSMLEWEQHWPWERLLQTLSLDWLKILMAKRRAIVVGFGVLTTSRLWLGFLARTSRHVRYWHDLWCEYSLNTRCIQMFRDYWTKHRWFTRTLNDKFTLERQFASGIYTEIQR